MQRITRDELREHLDEYLRAAEGGETIEVCDHERSMVRLVPGAGDTPPDDAPPTLRAIRERLSKLPPAAGAESKGRPHRRSRIGDYEHIPLTREVDVVALLREDRDSG